MPHRRNLFQIDLKFLFSMFGAVSFVFRVNGTALCRDEYSGLDFTPCLQKTINVEVETGHDLVLANPYDYKGKTDPKQICLVAIWDCTKRPFARLLFLYTKPEDSEVEAKNASVDGNILDPKSCFG